MIAPAIAALTLGLVACGGDDSSPATSGNGVDRAFATAMIPHHRSAVDMAEVAQQHSKRPEVKELANDIVSTQNAEIERLRALERRLEQAASSQASWALPSARKAWARTWRRSMTPSPSTASSSTW